MIKAKFLGGRQGVRSSSFFFAEGELCHKYGLLYKVSCKLLVFTLLRTKSDRFVLEVRFQSTGLMMLMY